MCDNCEDAPMPVEVYEIWYMEWEEYSCAGRAKKFPLEFNTEYEAVVFVNALDESGLTHSVWTQRSE
jgi:hypothetical protein